MLPLQYLSSSVFAGVLAAIVGLITFVLSWNFYDFWGGPMPGYRLLLFPGNVSLIYVWHPLFTEEVDLYPKLALILIGQFFIVTTVAEVTRRIVRVFK